MAAELSEDGREQITLMVKGALSDSGRKLDPKSLEDFRKDLDVALSLYDCALKAQQTSSLSDTRNALRSARKAADKLANQLRALPMDARARVHLPPGLALVDVEDMLKQLSLGLDRSVAEVEAYGDEDTPIDIATSTLLAMTARAMKTHLRLKPTGTIGGTLHSITEAMLEDFHGEEIRGNGNIIGRKLLNRGLKTPVTEYDDGKIMIGEEVP